MIMFAIGVAVGAAFAPFWMRGWDMAVSKFKELTGKKD